MVRLSGIHLGGFRSIETLQFLELAKINVLIGANGAGKSNLIAFFRLLNSIAGGKLQEFVGRAGGANTLLHYGAKQTPGMWGALEFDRETDFGLYVLTLSSTETDSFIFSNEEVGYRERTDLTPRAAHRLGSGHRESLLTADESPELLELLSGIRVFHFEDTSETAAIRRRCNIEDNRGLHNDAGNLAAFLNGMRQTQPQYYRRIVTTIRQVAPFFDDFDLGPMKLDPNSILLNWRDRDSTHLFGPHQLSDGTLRTMALVALLAQPESDLPSVIVIDEPEIGLHPYALEIVASLVKSASVHCTVVLATQSVGLVNHFAPEDIVTVTREKAQSKFERQDSESLAVWLQDYAIGEIWERNLIGGTPSR
jgi:predicted ATPase